MPEHKKIEAQIKILQVFQAIQEEQSGTIATPLCDLDQPGPPGCNLPSTTLRDHSYIKQQLNKSTLQTATSPIVTPIRPQNSLKWKCTPTCSQTVIVSPDDSLQDDGEIYNICEDYNINFNAESP